MGHLIKSLLLLRKKSILSPFITNPRRFFNNGLPFLDFYYQTTGHKIPEDNLPTLKKKHPNIEKLTKDRIQIILQILEKFGISPVDACSNLHLFSMNPISTDNYGEILKECGFICIQSQHIIKYHTIVKNRTISSLKKEGLVSQDLELEQTLLNSFREWSQSCRTTLDFPESSTSILTIRTSVLQRYLKWKLSITTEQFENYCRNYLPLRHKPMSDIEESLNLAENTIKFNIEVIRRNGFIISADPINTRLILDNVKILAGLDITEVIRIEPAILKNNYNALLQIRDILEEYRIPLQFQQKCPKVFCMRPETVRERLDELKHMKEFSILSTNPRILSLVIHKKKVMNRLEKIQAAKKQCYSFNHLISSSKIFNNYISSFGSKACGRDITILVNSYLKVTKEQTDKTVLNQLKRHKYWHHVSLAAIDENIQFLKQNFDDIVIFNNCYILLYPIADIKSYTDLFLQIRRDTEPKPFSKHQFDLLYNNIEHKSITDNQILSLALYEIEKKYYFSGDGIWSKNETKMECQNS